MNDYRVLFTTKSLLLTQIKVSRSEITPKQLERKYDYVICDEF